MAKLKLPLLSFEASGQIGKAAVFFTWKGIKVVRVHVIPTNPRSAAQTTQRGYMTDAQAQWHSTAWTVRDFGAWTKFASIATTVRTGHNMFTSEYINVRVATGTWSELYDADDGLAGGVDRELKVVGAAGLANVRVRHGLKTRVMTNDAACIWDAVNLWWDYGIPLGTYTSGDRVYFQFYDGATWGARIGCTGIYYFDMP